VIMSGENIEHDDIKPKRVKRIEVAIVYGID
jgi:hypothetical protein